MKLLNARPSLHTAATTTTRGDNFGYANIDECVKINPPEREFVNSSFLIMPYVAFVAEHF